MKRVGSTIALTILAACGGGGGGGDSPPALPADPTTIGGVSGTASHGNSLTITGTAFGTKSRPGPMLWDDFEGGTPGGNVATTGTSAVPLLHEGDLASYSSYVNSGDRTDILFNNNVPKANSSLHARNVSSADDYSGLDISPLTFSAAGHRLYINFYYRWNFTGNTLPRQTKATTHYRGTSDRAYFSTAFGNCEAGGWRAHVTLSGEGDDLFGPSGPSLDNEWVRLETDMIQSGVSVPSGQYLLTMYRNALGTPARESGGFTNIVMRTSNENWDFVVLGNAFYSWCGGDGGATFDVDDVYIDNTPARVEVCNTPTWAARTRCELQLPTAWSNTSVTVTFKRGYLSAGTAYVYVVNTAGGVNAAGLPITIVP